MIRLFAALIALTLLSACAEPVWAPEEDVRKYAFSDPKPPSLTLITVINKRNGSGAHTGLLINGSQSVMWDPAGTWWNPRAPERNDLHYGLTPGMVRTYIDYHTREAYDTITQKIDVSPQVAEAALRAASNYGAVPKAQCSISTTRILAGLPGFETLDVTYFPLRTMKAFGQLPGVSQRKYVDADFPPPDPSIVPVTRESIRVSQNATR